METKDVRKKLVKLLTTNPELPIVAMVSWDVVGGDECNWWCGSIADVAIEPVWDDGINHIWTWAEATDDPLGFLELYGMDEDTDTKAIERIEGLPWKKAITVYINNEIDDLLKRKHMERG